jgi:hypothetical protein
MDSQQPGSEPRRPPDPNGRNRSLLGWVLAAAAIFVGVLLLAMLIAFVGTVWAIALGGTALLLGIGLAIYLVYKISTLDWPRGDRR